MSLYYERGYLWLYILVNVEFYCHFCVYNVVPVYLLPCFTSMTTMETSFILNFVLSLTNWLMEVNGHQSDLATNILVNKLYISQKAISHKGFK